VCACLQKPEMANDHPVDKRSARLGSSSQQRMCILHIRKTTLQYAVRSVLADTAQAEMMALPSVQSAAAGCDLNPLCMMTSLP